MIQGERRGGKIPVEDEGRQEEGGVVPLQPPLYQPGPVDLLSSPSPWVVTSEWNQGGQGGAFGGGEAGGALPSLIPPLYMGGPGGVQGAPGDLPSFLPPLYSNQGELAPLPPPYGYPQVGPGGMQGGQGGLGGQGGWYGPGAVGLVQGGGQEQRGQGIGDQWVRREQLPPLTPTTTL